MRSGKGNCLTVRELLSEFSASDLLSRFPKYPFEPPYDEGAYQAFYDRLIRMRPVRSGVVVLGVPWPQDDDEGWMQVRCFRIDELVAKFDFTDPLLKVKDPRRMSLKALEALPRRWQLPGEQGMEIVKARNTLGYEVFGPNADRVGRVNLATSLFYELSSYGLTVRAQRAAMRRLERDIRQSEKEIAQGKTHTLDELREELGIPKPTKREEARRHRRALVEGTRLGRDLIGAMAEYVRFKKNACCVGLKGASETAERREGGCVRNVRRKNLV